MTSPVKGNQLIVLDNCPICQDTISENKITTACNHTFDTKCFNQWIITKIQDASEVPCPLCRKTVYQLNPDPDHSLIQRTNSFVRSIAPAAASFEPDLVPLPVDNVFGNFNYSIDRTPNNPHVLSTRQIYQIRALLNRGFLISDYNLLLTFYMADRTLRLAENLSLSRATIVITPVENGELVSLFVDMFS